MSYIVDQGVAGPKTVGDGTAQPLRLGRDGGLVTQDAHSRYQEAILRGNVYSLSVGAGAPTAYTGAAAGTPLLCIHNPANSGKNLVVLAVLVGVSTVPVITTTSASTPVEAYIGPSTLPTGTTTAPLNLLTGATSGSIAKGFVNTALTGSTALTLALGGLSTIAAVSNATVEVAFQISHSWIEVAGMLNAIPGNEVTIGVRTVPGSLAVDATIIWEEVPYTTTGG